MTVPVSELRKAGAMPSVRSRSAPRRDGPAGTELSLEVHRGPRGLSSLREAWMRLTAAMDAPHCGHFFEWHQSRVESLTPDPDRELFVLVRRGGVPLAIFPLRRSDRGFARAGLRVLEIPWHPHTLVTDFIFERASSNRDLLSWVLANLGRQTDLRWDVLRCELFLEDSCLEFGLAAFPPQRVLREAGPSCDVLPCRPFADVKESVSKNFRGNLRKAQNKLERLADVRTTTARSPTELASALDAFLAIEASGWKGTGGTGSAIGLDPRLLSFYRSLFARFGEHGAAEIHLLHGDGQPLAGDLCLTLGSTTFMLKVAYNETFAAVAPGNMLLGAVLDEYAREGRVSDINLMTDAAWHTNWKPRPLRTASAWIFNTTARGFAARKLLALRRRWRDARRVDAERDAAGDAQPARSDAGALTETDS